MDTNLLRSWLSLPPGPWPPGDFTLLGLPRGPVDPADAERRALERMGRLRPHQLVHPDLVTEGMNRLAQAMLAVTSAAPAAPLPITPPAAPLAAPRATTAIPSPTVLPPADDEPGSSFGGANEAPFDPDKPTDLDLRPLAPAESPPPPRRVAPVAPPPVAPETVPEELAPTEVVPEQVALKAGRRAAYRELAGLRALLRAWDALRTTTAVPSASLATPADVCDFLEAVAQFRDAARHPGLDPGYVRDTAPVLGAVLFQPLPLATLRSLTLTQRRALAKDWATGKVRLLARTAGVREAVGRAGRPAGLGRDGGWHVLARYPEWALVAATGGVMLAVLVAGRLAAR
ncbi:MAG: hypothetical protein U0871_21940 [Gemmataceae bacterium]